MANNTYDMLMSGKSDSNIRFADFRNLILSYGFCERINMSKYSMVMSWSEEDQAYIVAVPELPGCMADGRTPEEAAKNTEIIIQEWIETALEDGEEIPEPHLFSMPV